MNGADKKLNEMNRLAHMGHFPAKVNAAATANVLMTVTITWWLVSRYTVAWAPVVWIVLVLILNLLPVVMLRLTMGEGTVYPTVGTMDFVRDQHKFSDWVYVAASANMGFWVLCGWGFFSWSHMSGVLVGWLVVAGVVTFSPVLRRVL